MTPHPSQPLAPVRLLKRTERLVQRPTSEPSIPVEDARGLRGADGSRGGGWRGRDHLMEVKPEA